MPKEVYDTKHSVRWITAQWKQEPIHEKKYLLSLPTGPSPVIAQRYDDGVLRVTVQSDLCRCVVAAASPTDTKGRPWTNGTPSDCGSIDDTLPKGSACPIEPDLIATYENGGVLISPFQNWVKMKYVMKFTGGKGSFLEIHQNGKLIVKLKGVIGYTPHTTKRADEFSPAPRWRLPEFLDVHLDLSNCTGNGCPQFVGAVGRKFPLGAQR